MIVGVGTGRCGTVTVAEVLGVPHEPKPRFIREGVEHYYTPGKRAFPIERLKTALGNAGAVNHRYSLIIPFIRRHFPDAKFVHIIRSGPATVASFMARKWYDPSASQVGFEKWRFRGDLAGMVPAKTWESMTPFEKCCWHWSTVNQIIHADLMAIDHYTLRIENLNSDELLKWAYGHTSHGTPMNIWRNGSRRAADSRLEKWTPLMWDTFRHIAGDTQKLFYS